MLGIKSFDNFLLTLSWAWKEIPQMCSLCSFLIFHPICVEIKISNLLSKWEWQKCPLITVCMKLAASSWRGVNLCYSCWQLNGTQNELRQKFRPLHSLGGLKQKRQQISKPGRLELVICQIPREFWFSILCANIHKNIDQPSTIKSWPNFGVKHTYWLDVSFKLQFCFMKKVKPWLLIRCACVS